MPNAPKQISTSKNNCHDFKLPYFPKDIYRESENYLRQPQVINIIPDCRKFHGKALILDSAIQCTERDEFAYHEVIAFLPLCSHPKPEKVLIVGGGNGGAARETAKHPLVKTVKVLEIDEKVVEICAKFIPSIANGLTSPKVTLEINDGFDHLSRAAGEYDVIITDATDPVGHSASLFAESYFALLKNALKPGGIICSQAGFPWLEIETARRAFFSCRKHFENVEYATVSVPTFPSGQIGFIVASVDEGADLRRPKRVFGRGEIEDLNLRYYNDEVHMAAFALPNFVQDTARGEKAKVSNGDVEHLS